MRRREFIALLAGIAWPRGVMAQKAEKTRRIVMLTGIAEADPEGQARVAALQEGLRDLGWIAGQNLLIEYRWGAGDEGRMAALGKGSGRAATRPAYRCDHAGDHRSVATDSHHSDCVRPGDGPARPRLHRQSCKAWRQHHRVHEFRISHGRQVAADAQAACTGG